ncbi:hypothetical protein H4J46_06340 [Colwellia sp. MB02u-6]|uniref:hypothetical protein n=1 Tax=Colwellia sp. MB02u-6 TaxID=2759824 RepID=UPI0015F7547C|nr:hypothetical protein [Colwellia sp. MB02u-6]MBA6327564.1 hypothetical protein [Colwellia sp. MB02u-6]
MTNIGFGDRNFNFSVYIENKANMLEYQHIAEVRDLVEGEINFINQKFGTRFIEITSNLALLAYDLVIEANCSNCY